MTNKTSIRFFEDHEIHAISYEIITALKQKGFQFVTIDTLLQQTDTQPEFWW